MKLWKLSNSLWYIVHHGIAGIHNIKCYKIIWQIQITITQKKKKKNCKDFEKKNLNEYHDFYLKRNPLLLADVFENFTKMCLQSFS